MVPPGLLPGQGQELPEEGTLRGPDLGLHVVHKLQEALLRGGEEEGDGVQLQKEGLVAGDGGGGGGGGAGRPRVLRLAR